MYNHKSVLFSQMIKIFPRWPRMFHSGHITSMT